MMSWPFAIAVSVLIFAAAAVICVAMLCDALRTAAAHRSLVAETERKWREAEIAERAKHNDFARSLFRPPGAEVKPFARPEVAVDNDKPNGAA